MGSIRFPETSVKDYHSTLRNIPEERRSHQHRGGSLKSKTPYSLFTIYWEWPRQERKRRHLQNSKPAGAPVTARPDATMLVWQHRKEINDIKTRPTVCSMQNSHCRLDYRVLQTFTLKKHLKIIRYPLSRICVPTLTFCTEWVRLNFI